MSKFMMSDTIRWKVVKLQHKLQDDMDVAKLLLDCYDAIISGCLQWEHQRLKTRFPLSTSGQGWKLLEEIMYMGQWSYRQQERWQALTFWNYDDDCDDGDNDNGIANDSSGAHDEDEEQRCRGLIVEPIRLRENIGKSKNVTDCVIVFNELDVVLTESEEKKDVENKDETMSKFLVSYTIRWKVVKLQHKLQDDVDVAKLLLDCYDAIISGCLQWEHQRLKTRFPLGTSGKGWKLLEEIMYMGQWSYRQQERWQTLTFWNYDDDCDDGDNDNDIGNDSSGAHDEGEDQRGRGLIVEPIRLRENISKSKNVTDCVMVFNELDVVLTESEEKKNVVDKNETTTCTSSEGAVLKESSVSSKKKRNSRPPVTHKKPTKRNASVRFLLNANQTLTIRCKRCLKELSCASEFKEHYASHTSAVIVDNEVHQVEDINLEAIPLLADVFVPCPDCNELQVASSFERHRLNKHFLRVCDLCGGKYTSFGGWSRHMKVHKANETGYKPYFCDKCGKSFALVGTLTTHKKLHSLDRPFICDVCGKGFKLSSRLRRHSNVHSQTSWACEHCGKTFNYEYNLKTHLRVHTQERPFVCKMCGKSYNHNQSLKMHTKSEHGIDTENGWQAYQEFYDLSTETSIILKEGKQYDV